MRRLMKSFGSIARSGVVIGGGRVADLCSAGRQFAQSGQDQQPDGAHDKDRYAVRDVYPDDILVHDMSPLAPALWFGRDADSMTN